MTLLHELREILENEFRTIGYAIAEPDLCDMEERAESFATHVQVNAAHQALPVLWENASTIERKWVRIGAYALIFSGALAYTLSCISIAQIENNFAALRSKDKS